MADENNNETPKTISKSERTNAKNLENLHSAIAIVNSIGEDFKPTNPLIEKDALLEFEENFEEKTQSVLTAVADEQNNVDAQIGAFKPVSSRISLIMKSVRAQGLDPLFVEGLQSTVYRLNGVRINRSTPDETPAGGDANGGNSSVSRRSYAGILESLQMFSTQLTSNAAHDPNEPEYKSPAISAWISGLGDIHDDALESKVATRTKRADLKSYAYNDADGLIPRMKILKNYLGYILDKDDPRLKQLKSLKFTKAKK